jgi:hypothetical protein
MPRNIGSARRSSVRWRARLRPFIPPEIRSFRPTFVQAKMLNESTHFRHRLGQAEMPVFVRLFISLEIYTFVLVEIRSKIIPFCTYFVSTKRHTFRIHFLCTETSAEIRPFSLTFKPTKMEDFGSTFGLAEIRTECSLFRPLFRCEDICHFPACTLISGRYWLRQTSRDP